MTLIMGLTPDEYDLIVQIAAFVGMIAGLALVVGRRGRE